MASYQGLVLVDRLTRGEPGSGGGGLLVAAPADTFGKAQSHEAASQANEGVTQRASQPWGASSRQIFAGVG